MFGNLNPFGPANDVNEITDLRIYPIKSCRGISLKKAFLTRQGLELDRKWMFVDAKTHKFLTIRELAKMTLINTSITPSLSNPGTEDLTITIEESSKSVSVPARPTISWLKENTTLADVNIWDYETDGYIYSDAVNDIFNDFFDKPVKLVYKGPSQRILRGNAAPEKLGRVESTNFPDVMPLLIANESSLDELNDRLKKKVDKTITIERFRPNIIVRGDSAAWSEDSWKTVRISSTIPDSQPSGGVLDYLMGSAGLAVGDIDIDIRARCARCQVPNVEPNSAVKDKHEPWDTLVSYRRIDEGIKWKPCFGMLGLSRVEGLLEVGMQVEVVQTTNKHNYAVGF